MAKTPGFKARTKRQMDLPPKSRGAAGPKLTKTFDSNAEAKKMGNPFAPSAGVKQTRPAAFDPAMGKLMKRSR